MYLTTRCIMYSSPCSGSKYCVFSLTTVYSLLIIQQIQLSYPREMWLSSMHTEFINNNWNPVFMRILNNFINLKKHAPVCVCVCKMFSYCFCISACRAINGYINPFAGYFPKELYLASEEVVMSVQYLLFLHDTITVSSTWPSGHAQ